MKIVKKNSTENCHFYSREISVYITWECLRNDDPAKQFLFGRSGSAIKRLNYIF